MPSRNKLNKTLAAAHVLQKRMLRNALLRITQVGLRSYTTLQRSLLVDKGSFDLPPDLLATIDKATADKSLVGPLLFHSARPDSHGSLVFKVTDLLFVPSPSIRSAAVRYLTRLADCGDSLLSSTSTKVMYEQTHELESTVPERWRHAAAQLADALEDDFLFNVTGFRQCRRAGVDQGMAEYLTRIIRPSVLSAESIKPAIVNASEQRDTVSQCIDTILRQEPSIRAIVDRYYRVLGHLPLAQPFSLGWLINKWVLANGGADKVWQEAFEWIDATSSPLARYHLCNLFVEDPDFLPHDRVPEFWKEVATIIHFSPLDQASDESAAWWLHSELPKHYLKHLECYLPGQDGERICTHALWMAAKVTTVLTEDGTTLKQLQETLQPEFNLSAMMWQIAHPPIRQSTLRYALLYDASIWSSALICSIGTAHILPPAIIASSDSDRIARQIETRLIQCFPFEAVSDNQLTYAFQRSLNAVAKRWVEILPNPSLKERLDALTISNQKVTDHHNFADILPKLLSFRPAEQILITTALRSMVYAGTFSDDLLWKVLTIQQSGDDVFSRLDSHALNILLDILQEVQALKGGKWLVEIPHIFAAGFERNSGQEGRRDLLFDCVVLLSSSSGTASAINRLLLGKGQPVTFERVSFWHDRFSDILRISPPWVAAIIRGTLANLLVK